MNRYSRNMQLTLSVSLYTDIVDRRAFNAFNTFNGTRCLTPFRIALNFGFSGGM